MLDVLFVDDDDAMRHTRARLLRESGLTVRTESNAMAAIRRLEREEAVLVVIADAEMPGPSGATLLETVRRRWPKSGRVLFTRSVTPAVQRSALAVGALMLTTDDELRNFRHAIIAEVQDAERRHTDAV